MQKHRKQQTQQPAWQSILQRIEEEESCHLKEEDGQRFEAFFVSLLLPQVALHLV